MKRRTRGVVSSSGFRRLQMVAAHCRQISENGNYRPQQAPTSPYRYGRLLFSSLQPFPLFPEVPGIRFAPFQNGSLLQLGIVKILSIRLEPLVAGNLVATVLLGRKPVLELRTSLKSRDFPLFHKERYPGTLFRCLAHYNRIPFRRPDPSGKQERVLMGTLENSKQRTGRTFSKAP